MKIPYTLGALCIVFLCVFFFKSKVTQKPDNGPPGNSETSKPPELSAIPERSANERALDLKLFEIHKKWLGTAWAYSGTTQVAGEGSIACGYFVTTTLREIGMVVDRIRLAQAASETMILEIADPKTIRRFSDSPLAKVLSSIRKQGAGYYIVGLDNHTGFLKVDENGDVTFIHSGPGKGVVIEAPEVADKLALSRYRVTGKINWPEQYNHE